MKDPLQDIAHVHGKNRWQRKVLGSSGGLSSRTTSLEGGSLTPVNGWRGTGLRYLVVTMARRSGCIKRYTHMYHNPPPSPHLFTHATFCAR
eukprot:COSAG02_NODE_10454_length_1937_cov_20.744831_2_plen_91_part_00